MTDSKTPKAAESQADKPADAIPEGALDKVIGGMRKAGEPPLESVKNPGTVDGAGQIVTIKPWDR